MRRLAKKLTHRITVRLLLLGAVLALSAYASNCSGNVYVGVGVVPYCCGPYYGGRPYVGRPYGW